MKKLLVAVLVTFPAMANAETQDAPTACVSAPGNVVAWWPGEGNAMDAFGSNHGTSQGGQSYATGQVGQAFSFDGVDDRVEVPDADVLDFASGEFAIEFWVKPANCLNDPAIPYITKESPTQYDSYAMGTTSSPSIFIFGESSNTAGWSATSGGGSCQVGQWFHLAVSQGSGIVTLYVDGVAVQSSSSVVPHNSTLPLYFGYREDTSSSGGFQPRYFDGLIDEITLYDGPLSGADIAAIYGAGLGGKCAVDPPDADGDGIEDSVDNCPAISNSDQADADGDGIGDACDDFQSCTVDSIAIQTPGFETPDLAAGVWTDVNPPGWTSSANRFGVWDISVDSGGANWPAERAPEGDQVGYLWTGSFEQTLTETLQADKTYRLQVDFTDNTSDPRSTMTLELLAGGVTIGAYSAIPAQSRYFETGTVVVTTDSSHPQLGQALGIRISSDQPELEFDNFRLNDCTTDVDRTIVLSADANMISGLDPSLTSSSVSDLAYRPNGAPQFFENLLAGRLNVFVDQYAHSNRGVVGGNEQIRNFYSNLGATVGATVLGGHFTAMDLVGVDLLVSNVPNIAYTGAELAAMSDLLDSGGTILFLGGEGQNFTGSTVIINNALGVLGSSMVLEDNFIAAAGWPHLTSDIADEPLMQGVNDLSIAVSGSISGGTPLAFWLENQTNHVVLAQEQRGQGICAAAGGDIDGDLICSNVDNCPSVANPDQLDADGDEEGDACDPDKDNDGVENPVDNCELTPNPDQTDTDTDGIGNACDDDDDGDNVLDDDDNCPLVANAGQEDTDMDGFGDTCDSDLDGDSVNNGADNCPAVPNPFQEDTDMDGIGDDCDTDDDNDGVCDIGEADVNNCFAGPDNCPVTPNADQLDFDNDNIGDACDSDIDGDGIDNTLDNCSLTPNPDQNDTDHDGFGDACDSDDDNDGVEDTADNCPFLANLDQADADGDGLGDVCDADLDGDGVDNGVDNCPNDPNSDQNDLDNDGIGDTCDADIDGDGVENGLDQCAATPQGEVVDAANGCSIAQLCPCEGPRGTTSRWKNHGKFVSCVAHAANDFLDQGLITDAEKDATVSAAGQSSCGKKN